MAVCHFIEVAPFGGDNRIGAFCDYAVAQIIAADTEEYGKVQQRELLLGSGGLLSEDADSAPLGEMEQFLRHSLMGIIAGGRNEIQRNIIAKQLLHV